MDTKDTKSVNLTIEEVKNLIAAHGGALAQGDFGDEHLERLNYLNKRLKAFAEAPSVGNSEPETVAQPAPAANLWPVN